MVAPDEGQVRLTRPRVHDVKTGHVNFALLERLYCGGAAHRPSQERRGLTMLTQALRHQLDGGIAACDHDLLSHHTRFL